MQALEWIAALAEKPRGFEELRRLDAAAVATLNAPGMTPSAVAALAKLDTPNSQRALVDLASRLSAPLADRQVAALAFADSVSRRGNAFDRR